MNIRENLEQLEMEYLSPYAAHSAASRGRLRREDECDIRPVYQRDRVRVRHPIQALPYAGGVSECKNHSQGASHE